MDFGPDSAPAQAPVAVATNAAWGAAPADAFSGAPVPTLPPSTSDPWSTALTPVPNAAYPWAAAPTPPAADSWGAASAPVPVAADPWGAAVTPLQSQATPANPYANTPSANGYAYGGQSYGSSQYQPSSTPAAPPPNGGSQQFSQPMSGQPSYTQSVPVPYNSQTPAPSGTWTAPPAISTSYNNQDVPLSVTPLAQQTPSSLGFGSPAPTFSGFSPTPVKQQPPPPLQEQTPVYPSNNGQGDFGASADTNPMSLLDQTFAKLTNVDSFSLTSKRDEPAANPFASTSINDNRSLADIQKTKVRCKVPCNRSYYHCSD